MSVSLQNLVAVQRPEPDEYLGYMTWYTICQCQIDRDTLRGFLATAELGEEWLPRPIRVPDAFRRAMKAVEQKKVPGPDADSLMEKPGGMGETCLFFFRLEKKERPSASIHI